MNDIFFSDEAREVFNAYQGARPEERIAILEQVLSAGLDRVEAQEKTRRGKAYLKDMLEKYDQLIYGEIAAFSNRQVHWLCNFSFGEWHDAPSNGFGDATMVYAVDLGVVRHIGEKPFALVKIGKSDNPDGRLGSYRTIHKGARLLWSIEAQAKMENVLHMNLHLRPFGSWLFHHADDGREVYCVDYSAPVPETMKSITDRLRLVIETLLRYIAHGVIDRSTGEWIPPEDLGAGT